MKEGGYMIQLHDLLKNLPSYEIIGDKAVWINDLQMDSRQVTKGSLFICISGFTVDGHDYVQEAVENGAVAIVAEKDIITNVPIIKVRDSKRVMAIIAAHFYDHPTSKLQLIGVTGTNGKTTTTHLIEKIFSDFGRRTGMIGTIYMKYGDKEISVKNTTPESLTLQKYFYEMVENGVEVVTMEVSSHALSLGRVRGSYFDVAVFTNLSQDHLDFHETMENYLASKGLLFAQLGNGYGKNRAIAVFNVDDPSFNTLQEMTAAPIITYGIKNDADMKAENIVLKETGTDFTLTVGGEKVQVQLKLVGTFSVYNALAAASAAYVQGIPLQQIKKSLEAVEGVSGRFERVENNNGFHIIVDYAHTPDSLENVLRTCREFAKGKVSVVVGCGGDRDKSKRPKMAAIAEHLADYVYITSDNPRSEDPMAIINDMLKGITSSNYSVLVNRRDAIFEAVQRAEKDEIILIAGKGHETYQTIGNENYYFDDRVVAKEAVKERNLHGF